MATTQSITPSNGVTWSEVQSLAKRAETLRAGTSAGAKTDLNNLETDAFSRIINDPSIHAMDKFKMLRQITGGSFNESHNQMISQFFQEFSQAMTMLTNILKMAHESMMSAIRNIRA